MRAVVAPGESALLRERMVSILDALPEGAPERNAFSRDWYLDVEATGEAQAQALIALAYQTVGDLLLSGEIGAGRRMASVARRYALAVLARTPPAARRAMLLANIGLLGQVAQVAARRGHPLGSAVAIRRMFGILRDHGPGAEEIVAVHVETALRRLIEVGRLHDALSLLSDVPDPISAAHADWAGVRGLVDGFAKDATRERRTRADMIADLRADFRRMMRLDDPAATALAARFTAMLDGDGPFDASFFAEIASTMQRLATDLGDRDAGPPLSIEGAGLLGAALDGGPADCLAAIPRMMEIEAEFSRAGILDEVATARMGLGRLVARSGDANAAVDWHVRAIEAQAALFDDPRLPPLLAGVTETLRPYYSHLIDALLEEGRTDEALLAAEHCKGTTWRRFRGARTHDVRAAMSGPLPAPGFASWFVEDRGVASFVVLADGTVAVERMRLPRVTLEIAVAAVRPNGWRPTGMFPPSNPRALRMLDQFLGPLERVDPDVFRSGVTISPDGIMHNIPWHILHLGGELLVRRSVVRTVLCLDHMRGLEHQGVGDDAGALLLMVPATAERDEARWLDWQAELADHFGRIGACEVAFGEEATADRLLAGLDRSWIHLRSHGHFPTGADVTAADAFERSGLLLSRGGLPARSVDAISLTPERLLSAAVCAARSLVGHVSLEACVSGVVHDGAAGDPVGLPWVLALVGATSVVSSCWDVETAHAEDFFRAFYRAIHLDRLGLAQAFRAATLTVLDTHGPAAAGFRLLGV